MLKFYKLDGKIEKTIQAMESSPTTTDGAYEKHVPVIEYHTDSALAKVSSVAHPMLEQHYIQ